MLKMVYFSTGLWLMGDYKKTNGVGMLAVPRYYQVQGDQHGFIQLPGNPREVTLSEYGFDYKVEEGNELAKLYYARLEAERAYYQNLINELKEKNEKESGAIPEESGVRELPPDEPNEPTA